MLSSQSCKPSLCQFQCCDIKGLCPSSLDLCHTFDTNNPEKLKVAAASGDTMITLLLVFSVALFVVGIILRIRRHRRMRELHRQRQVNYQAYLRQGQNNNYQGAPNNPNYQNWNNAPQVQPQPIYQPPVNQNNQVYVQQQQPGYYNLNRSENNNTNPYV